MKLICARQAWHDAFYTPADSVMSHAGEMAKLGTSIQASERDRSVGAAWHQAQAGRVQAAIATLPRRLRAFGNALYSPINTPTDRKLACVEVAARAINAGRLLQGVTDKRAATIAQRCCWMADIALDQWFDLVVGERDIWRAASVIQAADNRYGLTIHRPNWDRDWAALWEALRVACDEVDREALAPVARVIAEVNRQFDREVA